MRVRFYAEKRKGEDGKLLTKRRPVFMTVAFNGKRVLISTKVFVDLQWWDPEKQRVKRAFPNSQMNNQWLDSLAYTADAVWKALANLSENPGVDEFKREFEKLKPRFSAGFFDVMLLFLEEGSEKWSTSTYSYVRSFYDQLKTFEDNTGYALKFSSLNESFLQKFVDHQIELKRSRGTIRKMVNTIVWFMNWATDQGYNIYTDYKRLYGLFSDYNPNGQRQSLCLEWDELMLLKETKYENVKMERAVDIFCFMCFSGLRFAEVIGLKKSDIEERLVVVRKKGKPDRNVPLSSHARKLLSKYSNRYYRENTALPSVTMMTLNKYIRQAASICGLNRNVPDRDNPEEQRPLHEVLTAGVATQTFIMNALRLGIAAEAINLFTGITRDQRIKKLQHELAKNEIKKFDQLSSF